MGSRSRWLIALVMASGIVLTSGGIVGGIAAGQETQQPFSATAAADGARVNVLLRGFLLVEELADVGGPTAQAHMSKIESSAYAAYPWPGAQLAELPVGQYPLMAQSSTTGQPESSVDGGAVMLSAKSDDTESAATARGGLASDDFTVVHTASSAFVTYDKATGTGHSEATNVAETINVTDVLSIGAVRSRASVASEPTGELKRSSQLRLSEVVIAGQEVFIHPEGLTLVDSGVPLPRDNRLTDALADAGVTLEYIDATESDDGVMAAGLRITVRRDVPQLPEPVEVMIEVGRARAFAQGGSRSVTDGPFDDLAGGPLDDIASSAETPSAGAPATDAAADPVADSTIVSGDTQAPTQASLAPSARLAERSISEAAALTADAGLFYPALAAAGVLLVCGATLLRLFGVRLLWSS